MKKSNVDLFLQQKGKYFPQEKFFQIKEKLEQIDDDKFDALTFLKLKNPTNVFLFALLLNSLAIDRFITGSVGIGIIRIVLFIVAQICYVISINVRDMAFLLIVTIGWIIWTIVEITTATKRARNYNYKLLMDFINR